MTDPQRPGEPQPAGADAVPEPAGDPASDPAPEAADELGGPADDPGLDAAVADPALAAIVAADLPEAPPPPVEPPPPAPPPAAPPAAPPVVAAPVAPAVAPQPVAPQPVAPAPRRRRRGLLYLFRRVVAFLFGVLQVLLILRILLLLLNANLDNEIVDWIISVTQPFVDPFVGIFNLENVETAQGSVLDITAIVALLAWTLIETLVVSILRLFDRNSR